MPRRDGEFLVDDDSRSIWAGADIGWVRPDGSVGRPDRWYAVDEIDPGAWETVLAAAEQSRSYWDAAPATGRGIPTEPGPDSFTRPAPSGLTHDGRGASDPGGGGPPARDPLARLLGMPRGHGPDQMMNALLASAGGGGGGGGPPPPAPGGNPNLNQQMSDWQALRAARGEDPNDWGALRTHVQAIGAPDPGFTDLLARIVGR